jgi:hypothetical protein
MQWAEPVMGTVVSFLIREATEGQESEAPVSGTSRRAAFGTSHGTGAAAAASPGLGPAGMRGRGSDRFRSAAVPGHRSVGGFQTDAFSRLPDQKRDHRSHYRFRLLHWILRGW